jgi:hypothetical protein
MDVAVLTLHVPERASLARCVASVARQDTDAVIRQFVFVDGEPTPAAAERLGGLATEFALTLVPVEADAEVRGRFGRIAALRRRALAVVDAPRVIWLDDDNWWDPDHVDSLLSLARAAPHALVHSWRRLWKDPTTPYRERPNPWRSEAAHHDALERHGIRMPGSELMRDSVYAEPVDGFHGSIDLGEWLLPLELASEAASQPGDPHFGEDDLLLAQLVRGRTPIRCTRRFTLNYVVGGTTGVGNDEHARHSD